MYSSTLSLTSALDGGGWLTPHPCRFTPGKETQYPFCRRLGRHQGWSRRVRKISPSPEFVPLTAQPVASRYTDYSIPARGRIILNWNSGKFDEMTGTGFI
jgi:hypothetical protein